MAFFPSDVGAQLKSMLAAAPVQVTASASVPELAVDGIAIDRQDFFSAVIVVPVSATLGEDNTLTVSAKLQDSANGTNFDDVTGLATGNVILTGDEGGSTETALLRIDANLSSLRRYIRVVLTGQMSATSADTTRAAAVCELGGAQIKPADRDIE
jgi:hypothetical protein